MPSNNPPNLQQLAYFNILPDGFRQSLQAYLLKWELLPGAVIVQRGDRSDFLAIVGEGQVKLEKENGDTQFVEAGESFGEAMLRYGVPSAFTVTVTAPTVLWILWRSDWLAVKREYVSTSIPASEIPETKEKKSTAKTKPRKPNSTRFSIVFLLTALGLIIYFLGPTLFKTINRNAVDLAIAAGRPELAVEYLQFVLTIKPDSPELNDELGYLLFTQGNLTEALDYFQKAVTLAGDLAVARNNLGVALLDKNQIQEAIGQLQVAIELDPGNSDAYKNLGDAYLSAGNLPEAALSYQRASELDPSQLEAKARWGMIALDRGHVEEARETWEQVVAVDPRIALAQRGLGVVAVLQDRPIDALLNLEAARLVNPTDPIVYIYLGMTLEALERPEEAMVEYQQVLSLSTDPIILDWVQARLNAMNQQSSLGEISQKGGAHSFIRRGTSEFRFVTWVAGRFIVSPRVVRLDGRISKSGVC